MSRYLVLSILLLQVFHGNTQPSLLKTRGIEQGFKKVPDSVRPTVYWYWLNDNISVDGVRKDLEAMSEVGIGRAFIGNIGFGKQDPYGSVRLFSDEWWNVTRAAISTATKKNMQIGLFNSPGWSQSGGPWITPGQSMRYLASEEFTVKGPVRLSQTLKISSPGFQHVALLAFPSVRQENELRNAAVTADVLFDSITNLTDGRLLTYSWLTAGNPPGEINLDYRTPTSIVARSLVLYPSTSSFRAAVSVQVKEDTGFRTIRRFEFDRSNFERNVGFKPYAPVAISLPETKGREFRIKLQNPDGRAGFAEIVLSQAEQLERFEEKQLAKMFQTPLPLWNEYQWPLQREPTDPSLMVDKTKIIDLGPKFIADSVLDWQVPAGEWTIVRYGMLPTGVTNSPASPEGQGLEIDKINDTAMQHHFDSFVGKILNRIPASERGSLKWVVADSYETGSQNWTDGMLSVFRKRYNYDPLPWLPVLSGRIVQGADQSDRFLWDLRRLVADRVAEQYVGGLRRISHKNGLKIWLENYGHWGFPSEFLKYGGQSDEIGGEFWNEGTLGNIECRAASSAAHIYGKKIVAAESFTAGGASFVRHPALLKKRGDWSFTEGINNTLFHVFITQPYEDRDPGVNTWFGTEFNRKNTWFYQGKAFVDYIRRCNYLLQQGLPVNDVAYFIGEDAPKMTGTRDPELPTGYSYDYINEEVLMTRASVSNGRLVLPDGMSYRVLVLPQLETMRPELLKKIVAMVKDGLLVTGPPPGRSPSLENYPAADQQVKDLVAQAWGKDPSGVRIYGKGKLFTKLSIDSVFTAAGLGPDFLARKDVLYAHRRDKETEIYFLSNQSDSTIRFNAFFRVKNKQPELWDAIDGSTRLLKTFAAVKGGTELPLQLAPQQSAFIIFRKALSSAQPGTTADNYRNDKKQNHDNFPLPLEVKPLKGPWTVSFDKLKRGPSSPVMMDSLIDWKDSRDPAIRDYSGTAFYRSELFVEPVTPGAHVYLNTSRPGVMAMVRINGKMAGSVWTAPWRVDVTPFLKKGINQVEIEVVNTWVNRLIGDSKLPAAERRTSTDVNPYKPDSRYESSGLIGPVFLETILY